MKRINPDIARWTTLWVFFGVVLFFVVPFVFVVDWPVRLLIATNSVTLLLLFLDKLAAGWRMRRVPEFVLYLATFFGGSIGTLVGMYLFHHKSRKTSFQFVVAILVLLQIVGIIWYQNEFRFDFISGVL